MASIQQSMNQMLFALGTMSGLYAHSPEGKQRAEFQGLNREIDQVNLEAELATTAVDEAYMAPEEGAHTAPEDEAKATEKMNQINLKADEKLAKIYERQFRLDPSHEGLIRYEKKVEDIRAQKEGYKDRLAGLTSEEWQAYKKAHPEEFPALKIKVNKKTPGGKK